MTVIARCECCEKPIPEDAYRSWTGDGDLCATCTVGLLARERDVALDKLRGAAEALREIARLPHSGDGDSTEVARERARIARSALARLGGQ